MFRYAMSHTLRGTPRSILLLTAALALATGCPRAGAPATGVCRDKQCGGTGSPEDHDARGDILEASDLPAPLPSPLADDPMGVTIHRLSNGMTVYISTDRQQPRFSAWIAVRT